MKAQGNITTGKTVERHITEGTIQPYAIAKFYGPFAPARYAGQDVRVTGWRTDRGGYALTVTNDRGFQDSVSCPAGTKIAVYVDQDDAAADFDSK